MPPFFLISQTQHLWRHALCSTQTVATSKTLSEQLAPNSVVQLSRTLSSSATLFATVSQQPPPTACLSSCPDSPERVAIEGTTFVNIGRDYNIFQSTSFLAV